MMQNFLQVNKDTAEIILCEVQEERQNFHFHQNSLSLTTKSQARNSDIILDSDSNFNDYIISVT